MVLDASAGPQLALPGYRGAQGAAALQVRLSKALGLSLMAEALGRLGSDGTGTGLRSEWAAAAGLALDDDTGWSMGVGALAKGGRAGQTHAAAVATLGYHLGRGYHPPPDPDPGLVELLAQDLAQLYARRHAELLARQLAAELPAQALAPAAWLRTYRPQVAGWHRDDLGPVLQEALAKAEDVGHGAEAYLQGFLCGGLAGLAPPVPPRYQCPPQPSVGYHLGTAMGAFAAGMWQASKGIGGVGLGVAMSSTGGGAVVGVPVVAGSVLLIGNGARAMVLGARSLAEAISLAVAQGGGGSGSGGSSGPPVRWVDEHATMKPPARRYQDAAPGARKDEAPALPYKDATGEKRIVRFDGVDDHGVLLDRKLSIHMGEKTQNQALRQSQALQQNGMRGRWEVSNETAARRARILFDRLGIANIDVKVVSP